jgi:hypothetical protein
MAMFYAGQTDFIEKLEQLAGGLFLVEVKSINFTAVRSYWYVLNTDDLDCTLPASPSVNDRIRFCSGSSSVTSFTLLRNGKNINGAASNVSLSGTDVAMNVELIYVSDSYGWRIVMQPAALTPVVGVGGAGPGIERAIRRGRQFASMF